MRHGNGETSERPFGSFWKKRDKSALAENFRTDFWNRSTEFLTEFFVVLTARLNSACHRKRRAVLAEDILEKV
jgi:hypothetical protein